MGIDAPVSKDRSGKLKGAVVGVGYLGTFHAQKYKALSSTMNFDFVGVCDLHEPQAKKVGGDLCVPFFSDPQALLGKVDFVSLATTTPSHFELAKFFLSHGIHVNVEKPITVDSREAKQLVDLAAQKKLVLAVGHSERFSPVFAAVKTEIQAAHFIELQRHAPFKARGAEVSVVHDLMIHDLDLLLDLVPDQDPLAVKVVSAQGGQVISKTLDWVTASFQFASGRKAFVSVSRLAAVMTRTLKVIDDKKIILGNFQTGEVDVGAILQPGGSEFSYTTKSVGKGDNLMLETENFVQAIQNKVSPKVTGLAGLKALELAEQVIAHIGKPS